MKTEIVQAIPDRMFVALKRWGWKGAFDSWEAAQLQSNGYNADNILQKVLAASLRVKEGNAGQPHQKDISFEIWKRSTISLQSRILA